MLQTIYDALRYEYARGNNGAILSNYLAGVPAGGFNFNNVTISNKSFDNQSITVANFTLANFAVGDVLGADNNAGLVGGAGAYTLNVGSQTAAGMPSPMTLSITNNGPNASCATAGVYAFAVGLDRASVFWNTKFGVIDGLTRTKKYDSTNPYLGLLTRFATWIPVATSDMMDLNPNWFNRAPRQIYNLNWTIFGQ